MAKDVVKELHDLIRTDKKANARYWDDIDNLCIALVEDVAAKSLVKVEPCDDTKVMLAKQIAEMLVNEFENEGGEYPYVDEDM